MSLNIKQTLELDMEIEKYLFVKISQYDIDSRVIEINLQANGVPFTIPSTSLVRLKCLKPDGTQVLQNCSVSGNIVTVELSEQIATVVGKCTAQLIITDSTTNEMINSMLFYILVLPSAYTDDQVVSSDDYAALSEMLLKLNLDDFTRLANLADSSASSASASAERAYEDALFAGQEKQAAQIYAESASQSAQTAQTAANSVAGGVESAQASALESKSWAVGGTRSREGEDKDNSKYYAEQAKEESANITVYAGRAETAAQNAQASAESASSAATSAAQTVGNTIIGKINNDLFEVDGDTLIIHQLPALTSIQ